MTSTLRRSHLVVGAITVLAFLITGLIMRMHEPPVSAMEWAQRLLFRSRHIYILCAGLVNLAIGVHYALPETRIRRGGAVAGRLPAERRISSNVRTRSGRRLRLR